MSANAGANTGKGIFAGVPGVARDSPSDGHKMLSDTKQIQKQSFLAGSRTKALLTDEPTNKTGKQGNNKAKDRQRLRIRNKNNFQHDLRKNLEIEKVSRRSDTD